MANARNACRLYLETLQAHTKAIKQAVDPSETEIDDALLECLARANEALEEAREMLGIEEE